MKDIFTDLYNKVLGFFFFFEKNQDNAKDVACNRLKLVLMQDRTNLNPQLLERMRGELIDLLSKYVEMDKDALELNFEQEGEQMALMLSIPVIKAKDEEEIEAAIKAEEEAKKKAEQTELDDFDENEDEDEDEDENEDEDCECDCENCDEEDCECRNCEKENCDDCEICQVEDDLD